MNFIRERSKVMTGIDEPSNAGGDEKLRTIRILSGICHA